MAALRAMKSLAVRKTTATKRRKLRKRFINNTLPSKMGIGRGGTLKCIGRSIQQKILHLLFGEPPNQAFLLPPMPAEDVLIKKKTIVLDMDETLIHASMHPLPRYDFIVQAHSEIFYVLKRPGVDRLLNELGMIFELVLFTAGERQYACAIVDHLDPQRNITHRLYRDSCSLICGHFVKDLSALGRDLRRTVIVDDNPNSYALHRHNALPVRPFLDNLSNTDTELARVLNFFRVAYHYEDVRIAIWHYLWPNTWPHGKL